MKIYRPTSKGCRNCRNELKPDLLEPCLSCMNDAKSGYGRTSFDAKKVIKDDSEFLFTNIGMPPTRNNS